MTAKRSYCLADKPFPVSAKALQTLRRLAVEDGLGGYGIPVAEAAAQFERLRRSGYVKLEMLTSIDGVLTRPVAFLTEAGRALLSRSDATARD